MSPRSRKGGKRKPVPIWVVAVLILVLAAVVFVRLRLVSPHNPPAQKPAPVPAKPEPRPPKAPAAPAKPPAGSKQGAGPPAGPAPKPTPAPHAEPPAGAPGTLPAPLAPEALGTVSIVLDDVGGNLELVQKAAEVLPREVTFAVIPFLQHSEESARYLHERGFPVILHAPMEPEESGHWRGTAGMLLVGMPRDEVEHILQLDLSNVPFAEGINNHMGSKATTDEALMRDLVEVLKPRRLYFLDSRTTAQTVAFNEARAAELPCAYRSVFLDNTDTDAAILDQLDRLVSRSEVEGTLVAIGHLRPRTVELLSEKIPDYKGRGVRLLPLREVVR